MPAVGCFASQARYETMNAGVKCASAPAPSLCDAPDTSAPVVERNFLISANPAADVPLCASTAPRRDGVALACRFWLTFSVTFTSSDSGGDTCSATMFSAVYFAASALKSICSAGEGKAPLTPSAFSASIKTVIAKRLGSGTGYEDIVGFPPTG